MCTGDADCGATGFCKAGQCAPKVPRGATCGGNAECTSGFCVDGVCCDQACTGQCQACAEPDSIGTCLAVKGKPRTPRADCGGAGTSCYGQCDGVNIAACAYANAGASCGAGCVEGQAQTCDLAGGCSAPTACAGNFACDGTTKCKSTCAADGDCAQGYACATGKCVPKPAATCSGDGTQSIPTGADAGAPESCAPYRCTSTGACGKSCSNSEECANGFQCNTANQRCEATAPAASDAGGCAIATRAGASDARSGAWWALGLAVAAIAPRARRRRRA
jgi:hypothetical protein